jgi:hypothetical protein
MAEISIFLKKETIFGYGECRKNFNDTVRFLVERYPNVGFTIQNVRLRESSIYLKTQEAYVN